MPLHAFNVRAINERGTNSSTSELFPKAATNGCKLRIQCEEWFHILVKKYELQIFFPNENRVSFKRGKTYKDTPGGINVFWVCWKCNLPNKITYKKNLV